VRRRRPRLAARPAPLLHKGRISGPGALTGVSLLPCERPSRRCPARPRVHAGSPRETAARSQPRAAVKLGDSPRRSTPCRSQPHRAWGARRRAEGGVTHPSSGAVPKLTRGCAPLGRVQFGAGYRPGHLLLVSSPNADMKQPAIPHVRTLRQVRRTGREGAGFASGNRCHCSAPLASRHLSMIHSTCCPSCGPARSWPSRIESGAIREEYRLAESLGRLLRLPSRVRVPRRSRPLARARLTEIICDVFISRQ